MSEVVLVITVTVALIVLKCAAQLMLDKLNRRHVLAHAGAVILQEKPNIILARAGRPTCRNANDPLAASGRDNPAP